MEEHIIQKKYIKQEYCSACGRKNIPIVPTEKNLRDNTLVNEFTESLICRNPACELFQEFKPDGLWRYKNLN